MVRPASNRAPLALTRVRYLAIQDHVLLARLWDRFSRASAASTPLRSDVSTLIMSPGSAATRSVAICYHVESIFALKRATRVSAALAVCLCFRPVIAAKNARRSSATSGRTSLKATISDSCELTHRMSPILHPGPGSRAHSPAIMVAGANMTAAFIRARSHAIPRTKKRPIALCHLMQSHIALAARRPSKRSWRNLDNLARQKLPIASRSVESRCLVDISARKPVIPRNVLHVSRRWK